MDAQRKISEKFKLVDNDILSVDLLDTVNDNGTIFFPGKTWVDKKKRALLTFYKEGNCEKCLGNEKSDSFDMIISGYKWNVQWGDKNQKKCFELAKHAFYGVKNEPQINTSDDVACVLYQSLNSNLCSSFRKFCLGRFAQIFSQYWKYLDTLIIPNSLGFLDP